MSTRINLLDWRQERRERRKKQFFALLAMGVVGAAGIGLSVMMLVSAAVDQQKARNQYLKREITEIDRKIREIEDLERTKANLLARMRVIEELQGSRAATVHFFDEIVNTLPEGVNLTFVKQQGTNVTIEGLAESNSRVSTYMKNLDASPWFDDPRLVIIKSSEGGGRRQSQFTLQVKNLTKAALKAQSEGESQAGELVE
ncbi:MAG: PilN domain-containing protein [Gammaproteobacteria bacterium]